MWSIKDGYTYYRKAGMVRLPIRFGSRCLRTWENQRARPESASLKACKPTHITSKSTMCVKDFRAVATSAMREATNGEKIVAQVAKETGIAIEIIAGKEEARLVFNSKIYDIIKAPQRKTISTLMWVGVQRNYL